jgi:hypothetical protein
VAVTAVIRLEARRFLLVVRIMVSPPASGLLALRVTDASSVSPARRRR